MKEPGKGTHVAFINGITVRRDQSEISLSLIDASCRRKRRFTDPSNPEKTQLVDSNVDYSIATLTPNEKHKGLWLYTTPGLGTVLKKVYILRYEIS